MTYWSYSVSVDGTCKCSAARDSVNEAISHATRDAIYYQAIYPQSTVQIDGLREHCNCCHNDGTIRKRRPRSVVVVKCPECKGKLPTGEIGPIPFLMPDSANGVSLSAA
jgi:hypothetical protein